MKASKLIEKIHSRDARVGVIGLGYVGLPLSIAFARAGFRVTGFDVDEGKVQALLKGESYIKHIPAETISLLKGFVATTDFSQIAMMDAVLICVPTPLGAHRDPDLSFVTNTGSEIAKYLKGGTLVVLESTTYPGTTDDVLRPVLEGSGLLAGEDFFLAYSPEREDPNNPDFSTSTIPKVVGGYTDECREAAVALYGSIVEQTVPVSSTSAAEASKLLENIYRSVNIALVNELKVLFDRMGLDIWEIIDAAKTKPFGFQAFYPGPGLGGHCIPIDPFYLSWKAKELDVTTRFIELAGEINTMMPQYVVDRTVGALNRASKSITGSRVLILGLAYKKDVDDARESPSLRIISLLNGLGAELEYNDPYLPVMPATRKYDFKMNSVELTAEALAGYDCVLVLTDHSVYDPVFILEHAKLVVDTRNLMKGLEAPDKLIKA